MKIHESKSKIRKPVNDLNLIWDDIVSLTTFTFIWIKWWASKYSGTSAASCCLAVKLIFGCLAKLTLNLPVSQDRIYWTDRDRAAVFMANRLTGQDIHVLAENLNDPHDIVVFHRLRQPQGVWERMCVGICEHAYMSVQVTSHPSLLALWRCEHDEVCECGCSGLWNFVCSPVFSYRTIQICIELKWALHLHPDSSAWLFISTFLCVTSHIHLCATASFYPHLPVHISFLCIFQYFTESLSASL